MTKNLIAKYGASSAKPSGPPSAKNTIDRQNAVAEVKQNTVAYLRGLFEKGIKNSFSFSPSSYAQGVKRLNHYDARGNLIQQFRGPSIMDRLRKRKVRATDVGAGSAGDETDAQLEDGVAELDQTTFDDYFAHQQSQVNANTHKPNTATQAVRGVLADTLPSSVVSSDLDAIAASAGNAAAENVAALWRAEGRVRDLTEKLHNQEKNGAPASEIARTRQQLKEAEEDVRRLRLIVQADEKAQAAQAEARRRHRAELARLEAELRKAQEKLAQLEQPGSGASQRDIEQARANVERLQAEVNRLRAICQADDAGQTSTHRSELAQAEAAARLAHEHLAAAEKPGSGASAQQVSDLRAAAKKADAEVQRLRTIVQQDEAAQNTRNNQRARHRADLARAELAAQQAHERLAELEHPDSGASEADIAKARAAANAADAEVQRCRAIVQKDDEEYLAAQGKDGAADSTTYTGLSVQQLSLMEQGVLKVVDMLEKGETDLTKVFDDGVAELVLKTLLLANNGFAAAVEKMSRDKTALPEGELTSAEEMFIANAYVINACLFIINNFSLSPDTRHRQLLIEGYNAIQILVTSLSLAPLSSPSAVTPPEPGAEKEADIINPSFALSDIFNISVGCLNEEEEEKDRREAENGEDEEDKKTENKMKKYFVKEENDNVRKLFGFILSLKSATPIPSTATTETEIAQETENKLIALRILFTIYKSSALPSVLTIPSSPVYSGPYANILRMLLQFMNNHISTHWNPKKEESPDKRKEQMTTVVQLLLAILYVLDVNHNLHLFVEEGYTKTLCAIAASSPRDVLHSDSDEEERKTYGLLVSTSLTILDKIYVVPFKSPDASTSVDLVFLRSAETASFVISSVVPVLTRLITESVPAPPIASGADVSALSIGALFSIEDQNGLRDECIACLSVFMKNNILTAATVPTTRVVATFVGWLKDGAEVASRWIVEKNGEPDDLTSYTNHIPIVGTLLNNLLLPPYKLGKFVGENGAIGAFLSLINNKYVNLTKNNATLLVSTYPKIGAILNTFLLNFALTGSNSSPQGQPNIFLEFFQKVDGIQLLGRLVDSPSYKTAFTPGQQLNYVRAGFFFYKDNVVDANLFQPLFRFLHTLLSTPQVSPEDVKAALKCLVVLATKKENLAALKAADLGTALDKFLTNSNPDISKQSTQLRNLLR